MKSSALSTALILLSLMAPAQTNGPGGALSFNGTNSSVSIATNSSLSGTFTIELWANPSDPTNAIAMAGSRGPGEYSFDFKFWQGNLIHGDIGNGSSWLTINADATFPYTTGVWYHVAYVVTPTNYTIYANGTQVGSGSYPVANALLFDSNHHLSLGWGSFDSAEFMN